MRSDGGSRSTPDRDVSNPSPRRLSSQRCHAYRLRSLRLFLSGKNTIERDCDSVPVSAKRTVSREARAQLVLRGEPRVVVAAAFSVARALALALAARDRRRIRSCEFFRKRILKYFKKKEKGVSQRNFQKGVAHGELSTGGLVLNGRGACELSVDWPAASLGSWKCELENSVASSVASPVGISFWVTCPDLRERERERERERNARRARGVQRGVLPRHETRKVRSKIATRSLCF